MHCIDFGPPQNAAINLAREEELFHRLEASGDLLLFYVNTEAVVIGRNQAPWAEVPAARHPSLDLPVVRRMSGGGAVYHDTGNLNYSILLRAAAPARPEAATILQPVIRALQSLGLAARLAEHNAIFVGRHKVSGTAQYMTPGKVMTHGTLLVDADLDRLTRCLTPDSTYQITSRGRASAPRPVANLRALRPDLSIVGLYRGLRQAFAATLRPIAMSALDRDVERAARLKAAQKYRSWEWNVGRSPRCRLAWEDDFGGDVCRCTLDTRRGVVTAVEVIASGQRRARLQRWAEAALAGRRLSDHRTPMRSEPAHPVSLNDEHLAFQRWLRAHIPGPFRGS
jgi:lipoate-protein ligase A